MPQIFKLHIRQKRISSSSANIESHIRSSLMHLDFSYVTLSNSIPAAPQSRSYRPRYLAHTHGHTYTHTHTRLIPDWYLRGMSVHRCVWVCQHCVSITPPQDISDVGISVESVISRTCGRGLVILCRNQWDWFEFGSCDKGNPRVPKRRIISARTLSSRASRSRLFRGRISPLSIVFLPPTADCTRECR